jgi:hypothetical protein
VRIAFAAVWDEAQALATMKWNHDAVAVLASFFARTCRQVERIVTSRQRVKQLTGDARLLELLLQRSSRLLNTFLQLMTLAAAIGRDRHEFLLKRYGCRLRVRDAEQCVLLVRPDLSEGHFW